MEAQSAGRCVGISDSGDGPRRGISTKFPDDADTAAGCRTWRTSVLQKFRENKQQQKTKKHMLLYGKGKPSNSSSLLSDGKRGTEGRCQAFSPACLQNHGSHSHWGVGGETLSPSLAQPGEVHMRTSFSVVPAPAACQRGWAIRFLTNHSLGCLES